MVLHSVSLHDNIITYFIIISELTVQVAIVISVLLYRILITLKY